MKSFTIILLLLPVIGAKFVNLELEDFKLKKFEPWIYREEIVQRSHASRQVSVHLFQNDVLVGDFCLPGYRKVEIVNMRYSNNGPTDRIDVSINRKYIGTAQAKALIGGRSTWNDFRSTWSIGKPMTLAPGRHTITLNVSHSDEWGTELDVILFKVDDEDLSHKAFKCALFCFEDIDYSEAGGRRDDVPSAKFVQYSTSTMCAEDDNVKVAVYHETSRKFLITASGPKYKSFGNNRTRSYDGCKVANPMWKFNNVSVEPFRTPVESSRALIQFSGKQKDIVVTVTFAGIGLIQTRYFGNLNVGSVLNVKLKDIKSVVRVSMSYLGQKRAWTTLSWQYYGPDMLERHWSVPDFSWSHRNENLIKLTFVKDDDTVIVMDEIVLKERKQNNSKRVIFDNEEFILEAVDLDFWWQRDKNMTVTLLQTKTTLTDIDCIRVNYKQQWTADTHSRIFEICQDGLTQIVPPAPHGLDWVPFGSSVLIGVADPRSPRPYTDIQHIDVDAQDVSLKIFYRDNTSLVLSLHPSYLETRVLVRDISASAELRTKFPLLTFLSMWVSDGNADVDHITINGDSPRHVIQRWGALYGVSATFFRQCISSHNTQSPDIRIDVLGEKTGTTLT